PPGSRTIRLFSDSEAGTRPDRRQGKGKGHEPRATIPEGQNPGKNRPAEVAFSSAKLSRARLNRQKPGHPRPPGRPFSCGAGESQWRGGGINIDRGVGALRCIESGAQTPSEFKRT